MDIFQGYKKTGSSKHFLVKLPAVNYPAKKAWLLRGLFVMHFTHVFRCATSSFIDPFVADTLVSTPCLCLVCMPWAEVTTTTQGRHCVSCGRVLSKRRKRQKTKARKAACRSTTRGDSVYVPKKLLRIELLAVCGGTQFVRCFSVLVSLAPREKRVFGCGDTRRAPPTF